MTRSTTQVELLILGAGWTSGFLIPLLESSEVSFAATSRDGREGTIPFNFDPSSRSVEQYKSLPDATTVLITFPVTENVKALVDGYNMTRSGIGMGVGVNWMQLGSTGSFAQVRPFCLSPFQPCSQKGGSNLTDRRLGGSAHRYRACSQKRPRSRTIQVCICHRFAPCWALGRKEDSGSLGSEDRTKQELSGCEGWFCVPPS